MAMMPAPGGAQRTAARPRILLPGIRRLPPGVERYMVPGAGSVVVRVQAGDALKLVNSEGGQVCEIVALDAQGMEIPGILGGADAGPATGLRTMLAQGGESSEALLDALKRRGAAPRFDHAIRCFARETPAYEEQRFTAQEDGLVVVAAPGEPMEVSDQNPPTPLELFVTRMDPSVAAERNIPEPLAEPRYEFRIRAGTAHAYEVRGGEYIQILDIEGRECSDFQALSMAGLDRGIERDIDPTATPRSERRGLSCAGAVLETVRRGPSADDRGHPGYGGPARQLQLRLYRQVL